MTHWFKNEAGFTLAELLVSIFIIGLLSSLFLVNYRNTNQRSELGVEKQKLVSNIRLAQNYSLGSKTYDNLATPAGGWGVHFAQAEPAQYFIFADINSNRAYDSGEFKETKTLPSGITIDSLNPANNLDIVFLPPDPRVYVNGQEYANALITLKENLNNSTASVSANLFGLIDAD